jgi:hypothetical protein
VRGDVKKNLPVLIALVVAVTAFGIDPSHARRIRFSIPTAKAAPAAAAKPAPVAAAARKDNGVARSHLVVMPGIAIRPSNGVAATGAPMAVSAPMAAIGTAAPVAGADMAPVDKASVDATKREEKPAPPAQRHFVDLTPDPPKSHREIGASPPPRANVTLCYKTATGKCDGR